MPTEGQGRITVVIPCYNGANYVAETIESIQRQSKEDWRLVVVDDGSTDASRQIVESFVQDDARISLVVHPRNKGLSATRNSGAQEVDSDYLLFLDADDVVEPQMLSTAVEYLDRNEKVDVVYFRQSYIGPSGEKLGQEAGEWPWARCVATRFWVTMLSDTNRSVPFESIYLVAAIIPSIAVVRNRAFQRVGGWDEDFGPYCEDTDFFLRIALDGVIHFVPETLVQYRRHPGQLSVLKSNQFEVQYHKVHTKMLELARGRTRLVEDAEWFRVHRFGPYRNISSARRALKQRDLRGVARNLRVVARDYSPRRPPDLLFRG